MSGLKVPTTAADLVARLRGAANDILDAVLHDEDYIPVPSDELLRLAASTLEAYERVVEAARNVAVALDMEKLTRAKERERDLREGGLGIVPDLWFEGVEGVLLRRALAALERRSLEPAGQPK